MPPTSISRAGGIGGLLARSDQYSGGNPTRHAYYHGDGNGNITALADATQAIGARYKYDPYGNLVSSSGALAGANLYRFSSKLLHPNSGLYYYGYRFYEPNIQRWLTRDPLGEPGFHLLSHREGSILGDGPNLYWFVHNSPMNLVDPQGLSFWQDPPSGVKYCQEPELGGHAWLEFPGGPIGFYPGSGDHPLWPGGPGTIQSPDPHASDQNKKCRDVPLGACYDKQKFQDCIKNRVKEPPGWYCVIGSNCRDWADELIRKCKREARK